jgi:hypothetical protein
MQPERQPFGVVHRVLTKNGLFYADGGSERSLQFRDREGSIAGGPAQQIDGKGRKRIPGRRPLRRRRPFAFAAGRRFGTVTLGHLAHRWEI